MANYTLIATSSFGLESVVAQELRNLGYEDLIVENGRVIFKGKEPDIARCNIWLRTADRVLIKMAEFKATDFDELFQGTFNVAWEDIIPVNGKMHVTGKSVRSKLASVRDCQTIVKKSVIKAMNRKYHLARFPETGPLYRIEISLVKDVAILTIDTTGQGLHKRGYREESGEAPLRENLAAAIVLLSRWKPERVLVDPVCGSGTIPIEAALIGRNIAPGLKRNFVSESWQNMSKIMWDTVRSEARMKENTTRFRILASDKDGRVLKKARDNAVRAGVGEVITFQRLPVEQFSSHKKYGCIICNPPYGQRIGNSKEVEQLFRSMGEVFSKLKTWSFFILNAHPGFESFFGKKSDKNRKLYNGDIKCYLYEYFGPFPPRKLEITVQKTEDIAQ
ncbi:MAG TPA: class I SAM-dependent RNA methyltransferase [Syntrophorhabdus sp.]|nr:class I SAM-dependent RNA methyltransferase [Syntrophorhabdus sp.]